MSAIDGAWDLCFLAVSVEPPGFLKLRINLEIFDSVMNKYGDDVFGS